MLLPLSRPYSSRYGAPILERVDDRIFTLTYFGDCMACNFCQDACCQYGVDIEIAKVEALSALKAELEPYLGVPRNQWFREDPADFGMVTEPDYPGGYYTRTAVAPLPDGRSTHNDEACVFLDPVNRGCRIHRFALERGIDVHEIKPMICLMFPLSHADGELIPPIEFDEDLMVCDVPGPCLYDAARTDMIYYFGDELIAELDALKSQVQSQVVVPMKAGVVPLPVAS